MKKLLLIMLGAMAVLPAAARDFSYEYGSHILSYTVLSEEEKTVSTAKGNRAGGALKIPATVYDENNVAYTVTEIGDQSFADCKRLTSVTIPNTITKIGDGAFNNSENLATLDIPNSVTTIGNGICAFNIALTSIVLPESVTSIGRGAFSYCSKLTTAWLPGTLTALGEGIFANSPSLKYIYYNTENPTPFNKNVIASSDYVYQSLTLYVPNAAAVEKCKETTPWMYFNNIKAYDFSQSAVEEIKTDEETGNLPMFDIYGRKVTNPQKGQICIRAGKKFIQNLH